MKRVHLLLVAILSIPTSAQAALIDNSEITATGTLCFRCSVAPDARPPSHTIDDDLSTFWHGEDALQIGEVNELVYTFSGLYDISQIDFFNDVFNQYNLGELAIQYLDAGSWITFQEIAGDFPFDDFTIHPTIRPTEGIRLEMTYQGRGALGSSPAFFLSEIDFYGEQASIPEPSTLALLAIGLAGAGFARRRRGTWRPWSASA